MFVFIAARGGAGASFTGVASASSGLPSSSFESNASRRGEMRALVRKGSKGRGRFSDVMQEIGKLEFDLAAVKAIVHASEEEIASAQAEAADAHARSAGECWQFLCQIE